MQTSNLYKDLLTESINNSGFETSRNYISLSNMIKPVSELLSDYENGYTADERGLLKCRMGYWMEKGLKDRLLKIPAVEESYEIVVPDSEGLIKGHPDFKYYGLPGDCKSYLLDDHLPSDKNIPRRIYWQMNAYMFYSNKYNSFLVCESRESGLIKIINVHRNASICAQIDAKCKDILSKFHKVDARPDWMRSDK